MTPPMAPITQRRWTPLGPYETANISLSSARIAPIFVLVVVQVLPSKDERERKEKEVSRGAENSDVGHKQPEAGRRDRTAQGWRERSLGGEERETEGSSSSPPFMPLKSRDEPPTTEARGCIVVVTFHLGSSSAGQTTLDNSPRKGNVRLSPSLLMFWPL